VPFTPFHMGPGIAIKAVGGRRFSLMIFGFSQVAIDIEPLVHIIRGDGVVHGFMHTYLGATLVALVSLFIGRPICQWLLSYWPVDPSMPFLNWLRGAGLISWPAATLAAFVGTYSHVFLDSIMHADLRPFAPLSEANPMLHIIPVYLLHLLCIASGIVGAVALWVMYILRSRLSIHTNP